EARIAMMAMTTKSSISVKPRRLACCTACSWACSPAGRLGERELWFNMVHHLYSLFGSLIFRHAPPPKSCAQRYGFGPQAATRKRARLNAGRGVQTAGRHHCLQESRPGELGSKSLEPLALRKAASWKRGMPDATGVVLVPAAFMVAL